MVCSEAGVISGECWSVACGPGVRLGESCEPVLGLVPWVFWTGVSDTVGKRLFLRG